MGVADNRTYKNEYLFTDNYRDTSKDHPSIDKDPNINSTIKENPYRSNVEIEGNEVVLQPDLTALFKAVGKSHKQGGMDVLLKPNSFVFSDFDGLAIAPKEQELFELKKGGKPTDTPADVLKRNIDVKHYNNLVNIMSDPHKDELAKKSAALMLQKYIATLGNIAYIQESKKGFPQGLPEFSQGTAPVYNPELKQDIMANKQYMKAGGMTNPKAQWGMFYRNPYKQPHDPFNNPNGTNQPQIPGPTADPLKDFTQNVLNTQRPTPQGATSQNPQGPGWGTWPGDKVPLFRDRFGISNAADKITNLDQTAQQLGYNGPKDNKSFQNWLYNSSPENKSIIDKWHQTYGKPINGMMDGNIGVRWQQAINEIANRKTDHPDNPFAPHNATGPNPHDLLAPSPLNPGPQVPNVDGAAQKGIQANWQFTPWQKLSQAYNWSQYAGVRRYMPYRSRYNATYVDPALVNPEQAVGDVQASANQQLSSLNSLNPILRNAQASSVSGQAMNQIPGIRSQYDNQNASILNQTRQYNNQTKNNESLVNMGNDQTYYQQAIEGRKNFDNMRQYTANNAMNNTMRDVEANQKLAYNMLTINNPAYGFDWKTGNFTRNPVQIRDVQGNNGQDMYKDLLDEVGRANDPISIQKLQLKERILRQRNILPFLQDQRDPQYKKGGKMKNPYK